LASDHSRAGMVHSFSDRFKTRNSNFIAASPGPRTMWRSGLASPSQGRTTEPTSPILMAFYAHYRLMTRPDT
jgi:hypothetical protein